MFWLLLFGYLVASAAFYVICSTRAVRMDDAVTTGEIVILFPEQSAKAA